MKALYKSEACCGNPSKTVSLTSSNDQVTREMVVAAQKEWGDGIVKIAATKVQGGDFEKEASDHITNLYAYADGDVLFKPTLAAQQQFRSSFEGALSYFVATNNHSPEDKGFAIKGWMKVRFVNEDIITSGKIAMAMGNYYFTTPENEEVKVEYSFGYVLDKEGKKLRINLHHSSMPYKVCGAGAVTVTKAMVEAAQKEWGDGIVKIAGARTGDKDYEHVADELVAKLYAYRHGSVLFKPTLAADQQFRSSFEGALSYFVALNGHASEDKGFAIKGWTKVRFENEDIVISGKTAMAMGNYYFSDPTGAEVKVEYSFGYVLDAAGKLRINLHHSSLPYEVVTEKGCDGSLTRAMVEAAQKKWGDGIVAISNANTTGKDYRQVAHNLVSSLYAYGQSSILFKPTLAVQMQFRSSFEGAMSYFVALNGHASEDKGFAVKGWTKVRFENEDIIISGNTAMAMGNYYFTDASGSETKVEFSFGYVLDSKGDVRINLHHSSMPYKPQ